MFEKQQKLFVTVHAKTSLVRTKIEMHFLAQLIAIHTLATYLYSMSPMARLKWSAFLEGGFTTLQNHNRHIGTCGACQLGITSLEFYPRPEWCPSSLVEWSGLSEVNWWPCVFAWGFLPPPSLPPTPTCPSLTSSHPPLCNAGLKLMHTCEKSSEKA